jgi:hypothetical protein
MIIRVFYFGLGRKGVGWLANLEVEVRKGSIKSFSLQKHPPISLDFLRKGHGQLYKNAIEINLIIRTDAISFYRICVNSKLRHTRKTQKCGRIV